MSLDRHGIVRSFNRAAERMFGWSAADIVGGRADRLMPRPEDTRRDDHLSPYLVVGGPRLGRARKVIGLRRDGTRFPLEQSLSHVRLGTRSVHICCLRDISERRAEFWIDRKRRGKARRQAFSPAQRGSKRMVRNLMKEGLSRSDAPCGRTQVASR